MSEYNITINSLGVCIIIILQSGFSVSRGRLNDGDDDNSRLYSRYIACSPVAFHFTSSVRMCMTLLYIRNSNSGNYGYHFELYIGRYL